MKKVEGDAPKPTDEKSEKPAEAKAAEEKKECPWWKVWGC